MSFPGVSDSEESACKVGDAGSIPGLGRSPGGGHGSTQYSCLRISCTEEPGGLQSMESQTVSHDWATKSMHTHALTHTHTHTHTHMQPFIQARSLSLCFLKAVINPEMWVAIIFYGAFSLTFIFFTGKKNYLTHDFWRTREDCGHVKGVIIQASKALWLVQIS